MSSQPNIKGNIFDIQLTKRIFGLASPYKKQLWFAFFLTISNAVLGPARPYLIQYILDKPVADKNTELLVQLMVSVTILLIVNTFVSFYQSYITSWLGQAVIKDLRKKVYDYVIRLKLSVIDRTPVGTLVTRTVSDIETLSNVFSEGIIMIVGDILQILVIVGLMFYTDWKLTLVSLSVLPLLLFSAYIFKEKVKTSFDEVRGAVARLNAFVQEHIVGMQVVQSFNKQGQVQDKFKAINADHRDANIRGVLYYSIFFPVVEIITAMAIGLVVWFGVKQTLYSDLSFGVIVAFIMYINMFFRPIRQLADRVNTLQMGMMASNRVFHLIDEKANTEPGGKHIPQHFKGDIAFKNVWFAYKDEHWVLKDISFEVKEGKSLAFVGSTGAGKSTITNLLNRFYDIQKGEILVSGVPVKDYDLHALRSHIGVVLQDVFLFSGSIRDNISLFDPNIKKERIEEAAHLIGAHHFIQSLPGGYDFDVKERGGLLSVGQRQLISFIRALAFNPEIIILDEATSSVDTETEELIQQAIKVLMKGRTSIAIAHRLSTIRTADEIIVLEKGQIAERGNHEQLLALEGVYSKLYRPEETSIRL